LRVLNTFFSFMCIMLLLVPAYALTPDQIPTVKPGITPDHPLYFLDQFWDGFSLNFYKILRALRIVSDDTVANQMLQILAERKAELRYLEEKGRMGSREYEELKRLCDEWEKEYEEYTKPKLNVTYIISGYDVTLTVKNVWDREITYVTGGVEAKNIDTRKEIELKSPVPYPLNLKPGEEKVYSFTIPQEYAGYWVIEVEIETWDGYKLIEAEYQVQIPSS